MPVRGTGRLVAAALLSVWLCAWAAGEVFVLGTLAAGFRDLVAPGWHLDWLPAMKQAANVAPRFAMLFMGLWVVLWTIGGALGMRELARALFGEDIVRWNAEGLDVTHRAGPFTQSKHVAYEDIRDFLVGPRGALVAETSHGRVTLAVAGSAEDRHDLHVALNEAWNLSGGLARQRDVEAETAPMGWRVEKDENGTAMLVSDSSQRRAVAVALVAIATMPAIAMVTLMRDPVSVSWAAVAGFAVLTLSALLGAGWIATSRVELRPREQGLTWRATGLGREWVQDYHPASLHVERTTDADGDERFRLLVESRGLTRELGAAVQSPASALHLGRWLARHMSAQIQGLEIELQSQRQAS
ncbi:MAG: hypothetical protein U0704_11435 [Candidatus Eisenbacteria bacterium]